MSSTPDAVDSASSSLPEGQGVRSSLADELRDRLFGVALFFSGLESLYEGQPLTIETHRRQCRNLIQRGYAALDQIERNPAAAGALDFVGEGPDADETRLLLDRAEVLVQAYEQLFPGRNRQSPLSREQTLLLMETAAMKVSRPSA